MLRRMACTTMGFGIQHSTSTKIADTPAFTTMNKKLVEISETRKEFHTLLILWRQKITISTDMYSFIYSEKKIVVDALSRLELATKKPFTDAQYAYAIESLLEFTYRTNIRPSSEGSHESELPVKFFRGGGRQREAIVRHNKLSLHSCSEDAV